MNLPALSRRAAARLVAALVFAACFVAPATRAIEIQVEITIDSLAQPPRIKATDTSHNTSYSYCTVVVPKSQSKADLNAVNAQAAAAVAACVANGNNPPAGFFLVGDGPVIGPKQ